MTTIQSPRNTITRPRPTTDAAPIKANERSPSSLGESATKALRDELMERRITDCFPDLPAAIDPEAARAVGVAAANAVATNAIRRGLQAASAALKDATCPTRATAPDTAIEPTTPTAPTEPSTPKTHVVVPGDTLSAIAAAHGVPTDAVIAANPQIADPNLIYPGDVVNIPSSTTGSDAPAMPSTTPGTETPADAPASPPSGGLPTSAAEANGTHLTQFLDPTYNPTGPLGSANCGPASLAMTLDTLGKMPPGLTPEQRIDYARSLMNPGTPPTSYVTASDGTSVPQLDTDAAYSNVGQLETAASSLGVPTSNGSGWDALDAALASGKPVIANGNAYQGWRDQFPHTNGHRYGSGDVGHFNTILGKTPDGKYIVSDPMYTGGPVEMTRDQLAAFFGPAYGGVPHFLAVG